MRSFLYNLFLLILVIPGLSCEKLIEIDEPIDTITTTQVFSADSEAKAAMAGIYSTMVNSGPAGHFSAGLVSLLGGLSSDELDCFHGQSSPLFPYNSSKVLLDDAQSTILWNTGFRVVYDANSVLEGIAASTSARLTDSIRKKMSAEAKFLRAFSFFYLTNFYGDLPIPLSIDFNKTRNLPRSTQAKVYEQIIDDLLAAQTALPAINTNAGGERIYPDKWAATALLARAYLYTGDYENAWKQSNAVIAQAERFSLATEPKTVFLADSKEAIWQLKQNSLASSGLPGFVTPEALLFIPIQVGDDIPFIIMELQLSNALLNAFEPDDKRRTAWVGATPAVTENLPGVFYFPWKYKTGGENNIPGDINTEYYVMLRLGEQYLIRAEAAAKGAGSLPDAIADLNVIRHRAGLEDLPNDLAQSKVLDTLDHERRIELFAEWGHRWLDLKRTGKAAAKLKQLPVKQPWRGDYQLLYPIPVHEIKNDRFLIQNAGY